MSMSISGDETSGPRRRSQRTIPSWKETHRENYMNEEEFQTLFQSQKVDDNSTWKSFGRYVLKKFGPPLDKPQLKVSFYKHFPIAKWLPEYQWKDWIISDLVAGFTIFIILIPQGVSYAFLAGVPPQYGLYTCVVPLLCYILFGSSKHLSYGPFALLSLLTATQVRSSLKVPPDPSVDFPEEVIATTLAMTFTVGCILIIFSFLRLGFITMFLSRTLLSGLTCAAAFEISTSQAKHVFGIAVPPQTSPFVIIKTWIYIFSHIDETIPAAVITAVVCLLILYAFKLINEKYKEKLFIPIPGELIVCLGAILISNFAQLNERFGLPIVGDVPKGLPTPGLPNFEFVDFGAFILSSLIIAFVSFIISVSIVKKYGTQFKYPTSSNQELLALGLCNLLGGLFSSIPGSASLSRTAVAANLGCKSQLNSVVVVCFMIVALLWLTPYFYHLPKAVLASIILIALRNLFKQFPDSTKAWKVKRGDGVVWWVTWWAVFLFGLTYGIIIAIAFNLSMILYRVARPNINIMGWVPNTAVYRDKGRFPEVREIEGVMIIRLNMSLWYANANYFTRRVRKEYIKAGDKGYKIETIIIDSTPINDIDSSGDICLRDLVMEMKKEYDVAVVFAYMKGPVRDVLERGEFGKSMTKKILFVSVHDAVMYAINKKNNGEETNDLSNFTVVNLDDSTDVTNMSDFYRQRGNSFNRSASMEDFDLKMNLRPTTMKVRQISCGDTRIGKCNTDTNTFDIDNEDNSIELDSFVSSTIINDDQRIASDISSQVNTSSSSSNRGNRGKTKSE